MDENRFERIIARTPSNAIPALFTAIGKVYEKLNTEARFNVLKLLEKNAKAFALTLPQICAVLYENIAKDVIYFGLLATECNKTTEKLGG